MMSESSAAVESTQPPTPGRPGRGWDFPVSVSDQGAIRLTEDADHSVSNAIWTTLSTGLGERMMRPDFGSDLSEYLFSMASPATVASMVASVRTTLQRWEPRIEITAIDAVADPREPTRLLLVIDYTLLATSESVHLVYPVDLA